MHDVSLHIFWLCVSTVTILGNAGRSRRHLRRSVHLQDESHTRHKQSAVCQFMLGCLNGWRLCQQITLKALDCKGAMLLCIRLLACSSIPCCRTLVKDKLLCSCIRLLCQCIMPYGLWLLQWLLLQCKHAKWKLLETRMSPFAFHSALNAIQGQVVSELAGTLKTMTKQCCLTVLLLAPLVAACICSTCACSTLCMLYLCMLYFVHALLVHALHVYKHCNGDPLARLPVDLQSICMLCTPQTLDQLWAYVMGKAWLTTQLM